MQAARTALLASLVVLGTGALWGLYWVPVRRLVELGLAGAWGTLAVVGAATLLLAPFAVTGRHRLVRSSPVALLSIALGGFAFVLYSAGLVHGRVAIVTLLFYLTPVWSTLIGRYVMGWRMPWLRGVALVTGVAGLALVLGAEGGLPMPGSLGDWLGLASGLLWSIATTGIRARSTTGPGETAFVFAFGGLVGAAVLAPSLTPGPGLPPAGAWLPALGWTLAAGSLWWGLSMVGLMWAAARLEPARVGILLMGEVLVGAVSAAVFAGERLGAVEILGGVLVMAAAVLEVWPVRDAAPARAERP